jgi:hypothetical protein
VAEGDESAAAAARGSGSGSGSRVGAGQSADEEYDEEEEEEELSAEIVKRAARDFTDMRRSMVAGGGSISPAPSGSSPPTREELKVTASIISAETTKNAKGGEYVLYKIAVSTGSTAGLSWKVARRFREFETLHNELQEKFGKDRWKLPKKVSQHGVNLLCIERSQS